MEDQPITPEGPIILNLGKKPKKQILSLKEGKGGLYKQMLGYLDVLKKTGRLPEEAKPIIFVVERKRKKKKPEAAEIAVPAEELVEA